MVQRRKPGVARESDATQDMRDQEVLRANRELAAYFKGRRTEREARAALKIIKAFVRDRERQTESSRRPLPRAGLPKTPMKGTNRSVASATGDRSRRKPRRTRQPKASKRPTAMSESPEMPESPQRPPE